MKDNGYSINQMITFQHYIRGQFGIDSVEPYINEKLAKFTHEMDDFYEATDQEFEEKDNNITKTITRTLVVVKDSSELIYHLHEKLDLDIHDTSLKLGFDDGGECLKVSLINLS